MKSYEKVASVYNKAGPFSAFSQHGPQFASITCVTV